MRKGLGPDRRQLGVVRHIVCTGGGGGGGLSSSRASKGPGGQAAISRLPHRSKTRTGERSQLLDRTTGGSTKQGRLRPGGSNLRRKRRKSGLNTGLTEGVGEILGLDSLALSHPEEMDQGSSRNLVPGLVVGGGGVVGGILASHAGDDRCWSLDCWKQYAQSTRNLQTHHILRG